MGETENWDEFISPETGKALKETTIQFGKSFDPIISEIGAKANGDDLRDIANKSVPGGEYDIKVKYKNVGALLNGKYATSRSAGNYLAGFNAANGTLLDGYITFTNFQKLAGALHVLGNQGKSLTTSEKMKILIFGKSYGPAPTYGELPYQYRVSKAGWDKARSK